MNLLNPDKYSGRLSIALIVTFFVLAANCRSQAQPLVQELKPWQDAGGPEINKKYTTAYMRSRPPRMVQKINEEWTFNYFPNDLIDEQFAKNDFDDSMWSAISIPHSWQNYETTRQLHPFVLNASEMRNGLWYSGKAVDAGNPNYWWDGWGWYRKNFEMALPVKGKRIFIEFDGVMKYCRVYLNGQYLGEHEGGFNSFYFDITGYLKHGQVNTLAVAVMNKLDDQFRIPPMYSGNQVHPGGIYRDVSIVVKKEVYIPFQGSSLHEGGTFVTTPFVDKDSAQVNVKTWAKNDTRSKKRIVLKTTIEDENLQEICSVTSTRPVDPGIIEKFDQALPKIVQPKLWSPEIPNLYVVHSYVYVNDTLCDHYESPLGIRTFKWDYVKNMGILNGKYIHIHGTNRTQSYPWLNNAIPAWIDILDLRDGRFGLGHNFIRPSIHPNNFLMHDLFDQWGILADLGSPMIKDIDFSEEVQEQMVREAVRQHRNRPSIVFYDVGNETNDGADSKWIYQEDSTRIIHARYVTGGAGDYVTHDQTNMNMENLLRVTVRGWTHDDVFAENPVSGQHTGNEEWQHDRAAVQDGSVRGRIDMPNGVMWMYADDGAARVYKNCPLKNINPKGWVDGYRVPKYLYFLWKANYTEEPMVFIHPHYWQEKYIGTKKEIVVDSNCDEVSLFVHQKLIGKEYPRKENFYCVRFKDVLVESGDLKAVGKKQGKAYEFALPMASNPSHLRLRTSHDHIDAKRSSIVAITADVVDKNGIQVQGFNNDLEWEVQGPATLVGPRHWETDTHKNNADSGVWYISTPVVNLVRSNGEPGTIIIKVSSPGLKSAQVEIVAGSPEMKEGDLVHEFPLANTGRVPVDWRQAFTKTEQTVYQKMNPIDFDFNLPTEKEYSYFRRYFSDFIETHNPDLAVYPILIETIAAHFSEHVIKNQGILVADDYNFMVDRINHFLSSVAGKNIYEGKLLNKKYLKDMVSKGI